MDRPIRHAERLSDIFGRWPNFHDAEVVALRLQRQTPELEIDIHLFEMT